MKPAPDECYGKKYDVNCKKCKGCEASLGCYARCEKPRGTHPPVWFTVKPAKAG